MVCFAWGQAKAKCRGVDKGNLCLYLISLCVVFCLIYHCFWALYMCFYLVGDVRVKESKNEQLGVKKSNFGQNKRACRGMVLSCRSMRQLSQKPEASMLRHAQFMSQHAKTVQKINFVVMPQHTKSMPRHDDVYETYFWQLGFNAF